MRFFKQLCAEWHVVAIHLVDGIWSGFPMCCIINCIKWKLDGLYPALESQRQFPDKQDHVFGYVRCPDCIRKKRAVSHIRKGRPAFFVYRLFVKPPTPEEIAQYEEQEFQRTGIRIKMAKSRNA